MKIEKEYVMDENGEIRSVVIDFRTLEALILDNGLEKAMREVEKEEEVDLESAIRLTQ